MRRMGRVRRDWERHVAEALELVAAEPEPDEHGRTEDAEEADTERGYEHSPEDSGLLHTQCQTCGWWTDDMAAHHGYACETLPTEAHGSDCPCALCNEIVYAPVVNNWYPPLRVIERGDSA